MSQISKVSIVQQMDIDKEHIDNFELESEKGTKKLRDKFHRNAVNERNKYVQKQKSLFNYYSKRVYYELNERVNRLMPNDSSSYFEELDKKIEKHEKLVIDMNDKLSVSVKLGIDFLIQSISDTYSLEELNKALTNFIDIFTKAGIILTVEDFSYTMFTEEYMSVFLSNIGRDDFALNVSETFQRVYFECPKIIMQIKMTLRYIVNKYQKQLEEYMRLNVERSLSAVNQGVDGAVSMYLESKKQLFWTIEKDPYKNLKLFLDKEEVVGDYLPNAFMRDKNFNTFAMNGNYNELSDSDKLKFNTVIKEFCGVLIELKEYYRYEVILRDLISRYRDKDKHKSSFEQKSKEVLNLEKNRLKILKSYKKSFKPNIFGKINVNTPRVLKMEINEELVKLDSLYNEVYEFTIGKKMSDRLNDAATIYNLFSSALFSFNYMEKKFIQYFGDDEGFSLESEFRRYIRFLYSPYNDFLRKINGLAQYNVTSVIADKYKILGLNISVEDVSKEKLDVTKKVVDYIVKALCIDENSLDSIKLDFICRVKDISPDEGWELVNEDII